MQWEKLFLAIKYHGVRAYPSHARGEGAICSTGETEVSSTALCGLESRKAGQVLWVAAGSICPIQGKEVTCQSWRSLEKKGVRTQGGFKMFFPVSISSWPAEKYHSPPTSENSLHVAQTGGQYDYFCCNNIPF